MKKNNDTKKLPKFKSSTLGRDELFQVTGGAIPETVDSRSGAWNDGNGDIDG